MKKRIATVLRRAACVLRDAADAVSPPAPQGVHVPPSGGLGAIAGKALIVVRGDSFRDESPRSTAVRVRANGGGS